MLTSSGLILTEMWHTAYSVAQACPTLCDPMDCSTPGLPVHHQLPEFTPTNFQTFVGKVITCLYLNFPGGSDGKASACNTRDSSLITGLGRSPGEGNGNLLQYSCLENPRDRRAGRLQSMGSQSQTRLNDFTSHIPVVHTIVPSAV